MWTTMKELRYLFPAIKAIFVNKKMRSLMGWITLLIIALSLFGSIAVEIFIDKAAASVTAAYGWSDFQ